MSENETQTDEELATDHSELPNDVQALLRQGRKAQEELAAAQRKLVLAEAGIPDSPTKELFLKAYDGPLEVDAIKAEAEKYGLFTPAPSSTVNDGPTAAEIAAQQAIQSAGAQGGTPQSGDIDAAVGFRNAKSQAEVLEIIRQVQDQPGFKTFDGLRGELPQY